MYAIEWRGGNILAENIGNLRATREPRRRKVIAKQAIRLTSIGVVGACTVYLSVFFFIEILDDESSDF